jgi:chemotaxis protein MotB
MMKRRGGMYFDKENPVADWQVTYSSLSLILVVVFVMLVSYSVADKNKMGNLRSAVRGEAGGKVTTDNATDNGGEWINNAVSSLQLAGIAAGLKDDVVIQRVGDGLVLKFKSDAFFASGSASVDQKIFPWLDEVSRIAREHRLFLRVEGHTDDVPIHTEEFPSNWELSTKRAVAVVRYFIEQKGFPANWLSAKGFGQYRPLIRNGEPGDKKMNRRIEIYIQPFTSYSTGKAGDRE